MKLSKKTLRLGKKILNTIIILTMIAQPVSMPGVSRAMAAEEPAIETAAPLAVEAPKEERKGEPSAPVTEEKVQKEKEAPIVVEEKKPEPVIEKAAVPPVEAEKEVAPEALPEAPKEDVLEEAPVTEKEVVPTAEEPVEKVELTEPGVTIEEAVVPEVVESVEPEEKKTEEIIEAATWNVDGRAATIAPVKLGETYTAPQNEKVTVTFSQLPANPGSLSIEEITLADEQVAELGAFSNKAYDITSDMENGTFKYDLTLPLPEGVDERNISVKYAENIAELSGDEAREILQDDLDISDDKVSIDLDHFTTFIPVGPKSGSAFDSGYSWVNPQNVGASDNVYSTITTYASSTTTPYHKTSGFGFNIPADAIISGIEIIFERSQTTTGCFYDASASLMKNGSTPILSSNKASSNPNTYWPTTDGVITYGSDTDLWNQSWTPAEINSNGFGFGVYAMELCSKSSLSAKIDYVGAKVYYSLPDTEAPVIAPHADMEVEATSPAGAVVAYTVPTATDNIDTSVIVSCLPISGSMFAFGITPVTCNASDIAGNEALPVRFNVTVQYTGTMISGFTSPKFNVRENNHSDNATQVKVPIVASDVRFTIRGVGFDFEETVTDNDYTDNSYSNDIHKISGAGVGLQWWRLQKDLVGGEYTIAGEFEINGVWYPIDGSASIYSIDTPWFEYVTPSTAGQNFRPADMFARVKIDDQYNQFQKVTFQIFNSGTNLQVGGNYEVAREKCDLRSAGSYIICDLMRDYAGTKPSLTEGTYYLRTQSNGAAGSGIRYADTKSLDFKIDATRPEITDFKIDSPKSIYGAGLTVSAMTSDNNSVANVEFYITSPRASDGACDGNGAKIDSITEIGTDGDGRYRAIFNTSALNGPFCVNAIAEDMANAHSEIKKLSVVFDNTAPIKPTGLKFQSEDRTQEFSCGAIVPLQIAIPDWDDIIGDPTFSHYEYTSFHPDGSIGINEQVLTVSELDNSWMPSAEGAYGYAVRSVDKAGNKSDWALSDKTLSGSCQIIYDSTNPTVDLVFPTPGSSAKTFQAVFSENVKEAEAENPANYFLNNWPGAGGSGNLVGDVTISYDEGAKTATITLINSDWHISPEQEWGVQNIHDLAGNLQSINPYAETSTPMVAPITIDSGTDANWHNSAVIVSLSCTDVNGSGCKNTYYTTNDTTPTIASPSGNSVTLNTDGIYTIKYFSIDNAGNVENVKTAVNTVKVDKTAPIVTINPGTDTIEVGSTFVDAGATWTDNVSGSGTIASATNGTVNANVVGTYTLTYTYVDASSNIASATRTVHVVDTTAPIVTLIGGDVSFRRGHSYHEQGAAWSDNVDGNGANVIISGAVNSNRRGTYHLTYSYTDVAGNVGSATRTITVKKKSADDNGGGGNGNGDDEDGNGGGLPRVINIANGSFMDEIVSRETEPTTSSAEGANIPEVQNPTSNGGERVLGADTTNESNEATGGFWGSLWMWLMIALAGGLGLFGAIRGKRLN